MFEQTTNQLQISQSSAEFITDANCVSSVSLASGKTVSIDNDGIFTFSHFSSELHNNGFFTAGPTGFTGFFTAGPTGFTILTPGMYKVNISLNVENKSAIKTDQPITVSIIGAGQPYVLPFYTTTIISSESTVMVCETSTIVQLYADDVIQLKNVSGETIVGHYTFGLQLQESKPIGTSIWT